MAYRRGSGRRGRRRCNFFDPNLYNNYENYGSNQNNYIPVELPLEAQQPHVENHLYGYDANAHFDGRSCGTNFSNEPHSNEVNFHRQNPPNFDILPPELEQQSFQNHLNRANDSDLTIRDLYTLEYEFDVHFLQWEERYLQWRRDHLDHANGQLYRQLESKMEQRRHSILEMRQRIIDFKVHSMAGLRSPESDFEFLASLMLALRQAVEQVDNDVSSSQDARTKDASSETAKSKPPELLALEPKTPTWSPVSRQSSRNRRPPRHNKSRQYKSRR